MAESKNDLAWAKLFKQYQILSEVKRSGRFQISSSQINEFRESRLMAKFDHEVNLPAIFREHRLSILPVSRSEYLIGPFVTHQRLAYAAGPEVESIEPVGDLQSLDYTNLYSEAAALNYAYVSGLIDNLIGEKTYHTVSGRMSTDSFAFTIQSTDLSEPPIEVAVENSQCEIDGGYEGSEHFILVEAKNFAVEDFLVRQLYYPYRLWSAKLSKRVVPVLMTYSNDVFDFFMFDVTKDHDYNSLRLARRKRYSFLQEDITRDDISALVSRFGAGEGEQERLRTHVDELSARGPRGSCSTTPIRRSSPSCIAATPSAWLARRGPSTRMPRGGARWTKFW